MNWFNEALARVEWQNPVQAMWRYRAVSPALPSKKPPQSDYDSFGKGEVAIN
jgi:hypothetical protein